MANPPALSRLAVTDERNDLCYRCGGPSAVVIHDGRGCRPACETCRRWREIQSIVTGHHNCANTVATKEAL